MTLHLLIGSTRAELIFQPPYSNSTTKWQEAGSSLFGGIARIYDGFAALERNDEKEGSRHLESALADLQRATGIYSGLAESIKTGHTISLKQLPAPMRTEIQNDLRRYDVTIPLNESAAALVARMKHGACPIH